MRKYSPLIFIFVIFNLFLASCEVGLGTAVDTEPPSLTITYPSPASKIRGNFILAGTCKDDVKVEQVVITLKTTGTSSSVIDVIYADVDNSNHSWRASLNNYDTENPNYIYNGWQYPDGTYVAEVVANDNSGRNSGMSSLAFDIDNTPPIFILNNPGSSLLESPTEYGSNFKIAGTIADDHNIKKMHVDIYRPTDDLSDEEHLPTPYASWDSTNVETAGGTEVVFANTNSLDNEIKNRYDTYLYPMGATGDQKYQLRITLWDDCKQFINESEGSNTTEGNKTSNFYFLNDVTDVWKNSQNDMEPAKVKQIVNKTSTIQDELIINPVLNLYESAKSTVAAFSVNKDASPRYTVSGYTVQQSAINNPSDLPTAGGGQAISVTATMGRNGDLVKPSTLVVYQWGPYTSINMTTVNNIYAGTENTSNRTKLNGSTGEDTKKANAGYAEYYNYTVDLGNIQGGKYYVITADGVDENGAKVTNAGYYVFKGSVSETPPTLQWPTVAATQAGQTNDADDQGVVNKSTLTFSGTYTSATDITSATYTVNIVDENNASRTFTPLTGNLTYSAGKWSFTLPNNTNLSVGNEYLYEMTVKLKNNGGEITKDRKVHIDRKNPEITISSVSPIIESSGTNCVNGEFSIQASITETNLKNVSYQIKSNGSNVGSAVNLGKKYSINEKINTYSLSVTDEKPFEVVFSAEDEGGNITTYSTTTWNRSSLYLRQSTDKPVITGNNYLNVTSTANLASENTIAGDVEYGNVFDATSNNKIMGTVIDDDGLQSVKVYYYLENKTTLISSSTTPSLSQCGLSSNPVVLTPNSGTTSYSINTALPKKAGAYWVKFEAKDNTTNQTTTLTDPICFAIDIQNPVISETSIGTDTKQFVKANASINFSGSVSDDWGVKNVSYKVVKNAATVKTNTITPNASGVWTYSFNANDYKDTSGNYIDGDYVVTFIVEDKAGKTSEVIRNVTIDTVAPVYTAVINKTADYTEVATSKNWYNNAQIPVKVTESLTDVASVEVSSDNTNWSSFTAGTRTSGTTPWTASVSCSEQGENTIYVKVTDKAGNTTNKQLLVYIDTEGPSTCDLDLVDGETLSGGTKLVNKKANVSVTLKNVDGDTTGISSVKVTKIKDALASPISATGSGSAWSVTIPKESLKDGSVVVTATDNVGNSTDFTIFQLLCDNKVPKATVSTIADSDITTDGIQINGTTVISGTTSDDQSVKSVQLQYKAATSSTWNDYGTPITSNVYNWSVNVDTTDTSKFTDGVKYQFRAKAIDNAGNEGNNGLESSSNNYDSTAIREVFISQDSDRPIIRFTNISLQDPSNIWLKNVNKMYGTVSDDDGDVSRFRYRLNNDTAWTEVNVDASGSWIISNLPEGANTICFQVEDAQGVKFQTNTTLKPKFYDGTNKITTGTLALEISVDTASPQARNLRYARYDNTTSAFEAYGMDLNTCGGKYTKLNLNLESQDANGVDSVTVQFNNGTPINLTCNDTNKDDNNFHVWQLPTPISFTGLESGSYDIRIVITDNAGLTKNENTTLIIDNKAPELTFIQPSSLIGDTETIRGTVDSDCALQFAVSRYNANENSVRPTDSGVENVSIAWEDMQYNLSWWLDFTGDIDLSKNQTKKFRDYIVDLGIATNDQIVSNEYTDITDLYVWIKAVDSCGNTSYKSQKVSVDPQGDRPTVEISYPNADGLDLGGSIRFIGTAIDNESVKNVWLQVDTNGDGKWTSVDQTALAGNGYSLGNMKTGEDTLSTNVGDNGIKVTVRGTSWSQTLNQNGELDPSLDGQTRTVKVWAYASDNHNTCSVAKELSMNITKGAPVFDQSSLRLVQYANGASSGTIVASQVYQDDMSVKGIWYLQGSVSHANGIAQIKIGNGSAISGNYSSDGTTVTKNGLKFDFQVPIGDATANSVGNSSVEIWAIDARTDGAREVTRNFSVLYDNKAPVIETTTNNCNLNTSIANTNGFYSFGAEATEDAVGGVSQTGVKRIAFYFTRDLGYKLNGESNNTNDIFDAMIRHTNNVAADKASGNLIQQYKQTSSIVKEDDLYWRKKTATINGAALTLTDSVTDVADVHKMNIHKGGIVKVKGIIYRIESISVSGGKPVITLSGEPGDGTSIEAKFALANIVDNGGEKNGSKLANAETDSYGFGYYNNSSTDDGDLMIESFAKQGTSWIWDAAINSKNIPDGPITLHIVAFDAAGNVSSVDIDNCTVRNNAPRIAGMYVGTDQNGNGSVDTDEFINTYSSIYANGYDAAGKSITDAVFPVQTGSTPTAALTIKGKTEVKPVLLGGNGSLKYTSGVATYNTSTSDWNNPTSINTTATTFGTGAVDTEATVTTNMVLNVKDFIGTTTGSDINKIPDGNNLKFVFNIGDSTPGKNSATEVSNSASLSVIMNVALRDTVSATSKIRPFYWTSKTNNSLFKESSKYGHIEIAQDVYSNNSITTKQPKVSGMIKMEGIAQDNNLLAAINATFATSFGTMGTTKTAIATYNPSSATWTTTAIVTGTDANGETTYSLPASGWASEIKKATYQELLDAGYITAIPTDKEGTDTVPYTTQEYGHVVHWILYLNTEKINGIAANNVKVTVSATDRGKPYWTGSAVAYTSSTEAATGTTQTGGQQGISAWTGTYTMDVVPYITKLYTGISDSAGEEFARSATGKYVVRSGESIKLYGFNLNGASTSVKLGTTSLGVTAGGSDDNGSYINVNIGTTTVSGAITATVNGSTTLNNINTNPTFTSNTNNTVTACEYNCQANDITNNRLNDDVEVYIWEIGALDERMGTNLTSPMVKFDNNSVWYMSFGYGIPSMFVSKNGDVRQIDYSWNKFHNTNVIYDDNGNLYAVATNTDRESDDSARFVLYVPSEIGEVMPQSITGSSRDYQNPTNSRLHLEQVYNGSTGVYDINRVKRPKLASYTSGNTTYLAMAYYDYNNTISPVKFRFGKRVQPTITYTVSTSNVNFTYNATMTGYVAGFVSRSQTTFNNVYTSNSGTTNFNGKYVLINGVYYKLSSSTYYTAKNGGSENYCYTLSYAGKANFTSNTYTQNSSGSITVSGGIKGSTDGGTGQSNDPTVTDSSYKDYHILASNSTTKKGGEYAAVGIVPSTNGTNGYVGVACWYDASVRKLVYSYNTNPDSAVVGGAWQTNAIYIDSSSYTGWYVDMFVDAAGGIHIAYYNSAKGDLKYAYLSSYNDTTPDVVTVDSYLSVGTNITINARLEGGKYVPYIYYYNASANQTMNSVKVAWRNDMTTIRDGAINDKFTGAWESMTIPTEHIPTEATVCGGVPTNGTWANSVVLGYMSDKWYEKAFLKK